MMNWTDSCKALLTMFAFAANKSPPPARIASFTTTMRIAMPRRLCQSAPMTTPRLFLSQLLLWLFTLTSPAVAAISLTMADLQHGVGDVKHDLALTDGGVGAALLHGAVGCIAAEAVDGNCGSGFVAGFGTELVAGSLSNGFEEDPTMTAEQQHAARLAFEQDRGAIVGAALGYITSGGNAVNVNQGSSIARSAVADNRQLHIREAELIERYADEFAAEQEISVEEAKALLTWALYSALTRSWPNSLYSMRRLRL